MEGEGEEGIHPDDSNSDSDSDSFERIKALEEEEEEEEEETEERTGLEDHGRHMIRFDAINSEPVSMRQNPPVGGHRGGSLGSGTEEIKA